MEITLSRHTKNKARFFKLKEQAVRAIVEIFDETYIDRDGKRVYAKSIGGRKFLAITVREGEAAIKIVTIFPQGRGQQK